jgi:hypothetical protein
MCHYKHRKPTGEELHSRAVWQKGSSIGCIAYQIGRDSSSVCRKIARTARHKRFSACAAPKEGSCPPTEDKGRKGDFQTLALAHRGGALVPQADRRHLKLEYGVSCIVEPLDYSAGRSVGRHSRAARSGSKGPACHHLRRKGKQIRSKMPKIKTLLDHCGYEVMSPAPST